MHRKTSGEAGLTQSLLRVIILTLTVLVAVSVYACVPSSPESTALRWGGDAEGGAPFVEADAADPSIVRGFDVEIAEMIAAGLDRKPQFVQVGWASIEQSVERGDFEMGMSGIEDRPELRARLAVTIPYFEFYETLAVRTADSARFRTLASLKGRKVGTLGATMAYDILLDESKRAGLIPVSYDDDVHPYTDLVEGRVDAVLLDNIIAERSLRRRVGSFYIQPTPVATGQYVAVLAQRDSSLRDSANVILRTAMVDGSLERVFKSWNVWDSRQIAYFANQIAAAQLPQSTQRAQPRDRSVSAYLPALFRAAGVTLVLSFLAMTLAVLLGIGVAAGRVYGHPVLRPLLTIYVEVVRGTPLLLQLFVIYYGLSGIVRLPAFLAAVLGLGLNYAAYEAEIYRSALNAISPLQLEAGRTLGLSEFKILRLIRGPQALRIALAPMTNDFVALLKDSSLVSVITVIELTKQTSIYATNIGSWVIPGMLCATVYLAMSLPLSQLARVIERRWSVA